MSESEEKHSRLRETADLWQPKWNEKQTVLATAIRTPTGTSVRWKVQWLRAGVWGVWSNPRVMVTVDCRETDRGEVREKIVMGNAFGGKPGSHGRKAVPLSHM